VYQWEVLSTESNLYHRACYNKYLYYRSCTNETSCLQSPTFTTEHVTINIYITGRVPMRRLVYRVQPLPQSMLPLVWDFGQLNTEVEEMYIRQMVLRYVSFHLFVLKLHVKAHIFYTSTVNLPIKTEHMLRVVVQLVNIFTVLHMIGQSKKNERLLDVTSYGMLLDISVSQRKKYTTSILF
jgi:hypothetical protein